MINTVPLTLEQIVEEARHWPPEKIGELVGRLTEGVQASDTQIEAAWKTEIDRRVEEIQSGKVQGIPGEEVSARIRKIIGRCNRMSFIRRPTKSTPGQSSITPPSHPNWAAASTTKSNDLLRGSPPA